MNNLIIKNGNFYRGDVLVPLEFGNREQIDTLRKYNKHYKSHREGIEAEPVTEMSYSTEISIECLCGKTLYFVSETDFEDDEVLIGQQTSCANCGNKYKVFRHPDDSDLCLVKLI